MKIAVPVNEKNIKSEVYPSFGRTPYYIIYDTQTKASVFLDNTAAASSGGAGIKASQLLVDNGVGVVIAPRVGENAANVLSDAGIIIYKSSPGSAENNIRACENNRLSPLTEIHPGYHGHGKG